MPFEGLSLIDRHALRLRGEWNGDWSGGRRTRPNSFELRAAGREGCETAAPLTCYKFFFSSFFLCVCLSVCDTPTVTQAICVRTRRGAFNNWVTAKSRVLLEQPPFWRISLPLSPSFSLFHIHTYTVTNTATRAAGKREKRHQIVHQSVPFFRAGFIAGPSGDLQVGVPGLAASGVWREEEGRKTRSETPKQTPEGHQTTILAPFLDLCR